MFVSRSVWAKRDKGVVLRDGAGGTFVFLRGSKTDAAGGV